MGTMCDRIDTAAESIAFAGGVLTERRHVCAFFDSASDERRVMLPFIADGLARGQKAFHIVDPELRAAYIDHLVAVGVDMPACQASGQFELRTWDETYLRSGHFDQDAMLALLEGVLKAGPEQGFPLTRLVAHMEWALEDRPGVDDLVEYETRLNYVLPRYKDPVI
jgi:DcmR-like sensory protein